MNRGFLIALLLVAIFAGGCRKGGELSGFHYFENDVWERFKFIQFEFPVDNVNQQWNVWVVVLHTENFENRSLPLNIEMVTPAGDSRVLDIPVFIRSVESDAWLGEPEEDYYVVKTLTHPKIRFTETGTLKFEIENFNSKYFTPGIKAIGIALEPVK